MDSNGLSDPYVKMHLLPGASKSCKQRTKTIPKTLNPVWDEHVVYHGISREDLATKTLRLSVLDEDTFGFDFIGEHRFALKQLRVDEMRNVCVMLDHKLAVSRTFLNLISFRMHS